MTAHFSRVTIAAGLFCLASQGAAQDIPYFKLDSDSIYVFTDETDARFELLQFAFEFNADDVIYGLDLGIELFDPDDIWDFDDIEGTFTYDFWAGARLSPVVLAGVGVTGEAGKEPGFTGLEAFAQYENGLFGVAARLAQDDLESDTLISSVFAEIWPSDFVSLGAVASQNSDLDSTDYYLSAAYYGDVFYGRGFYQGNSDSDVGLAGVRSRLALGDIYFLSAVYDERTGLDTGEERFAGLGAGIDLLGFAEIEVNYGQYQIDPVIVEPTEIDRLQLVVNFNLGPGSYRLDKRFDDAIRDDQLSGLAVFGTFAAE